LQISLGEEGGDSGHQRGAYILHSFIHPTAAAQSTGYLQELRNGMGQKTREGLRLSLNFSEYLGKDRASNALPEPGGQAHSLTNTRIFGGLDNDFMQLFFKSLNYAL